MLNNLVDLHIHSYYSDGTMTPVEIVEAAINAGVCTLAITDHNCLEGSRELSELAKNSGISCITGVELDTVEDGINYHILAYGIDLENEEFQQLVGRNRELLEEVNRKLIMKMEGDNIGISLKEYSEYSYDIRLGGWKALHYFMHKGLAKSLSEGMLLYSMYNHTNSSVDFPRINEVCQWIHNAGGKAILAHPGKVIRAKDKDEFLDKLIKLFDYRINGIDGIECYYPSHSEEITNICVNLCKERKLIITSGSDCHGDFQTTVIGQMNKTMKEVDVERLLGSNVGQQRG